MNKQNVKGALNQVKGVVKEEVGHMTGNKTLEAEGIVDRVKGKIQEGYGDLKDKVKDKLDHAMGNVEKKH